MEIEIVEYRNYAWSFEIIFIKPYERQVQENRFHHFSRLTLLFSSNTFYQFRIRNSIKSKRARVINEIQNNPNPLKTIYTKERMFGKNLIDIQIVREIEFFPIQSSNRSKQNSLEQ